MTPTTTRLHPLDLVIVALYLAGITLFGLRFRKKGPASAKGSTLQSYFLADNTVPWWAIALSIVSAETSTLTIISVPGIAFGGNFGFLQVVMGYMLGRVVVAALFLPRYFAGNMLTAYQLIQRRFGPALHKTTAGLFLLTRAAAEGVRVFAVSIVVGIAIGTGDVLSIAIISALTLLYTFEGGMAAVIWTDVVQMAIYIFGTLVAVWSLGHHVAGGWHSILTAASAAGKLHTFDFAANIFSPKFWATSYTFWAGLLGGGFLTMASHGTDQLMVQRMLAARNLRESRLALLSSGVVVFFQFTLFLLIGVGLWAFYKSPAYYFLLPASLSPDRIFPTFIVHELPTGIAGLLVAAILAAAMSNLSAALNSLSSSTVVDFYMQLRPAADARERHRISRASTVVWAFILFALAIYSLSVGGKGHVVETGLSIASVAYGALLGVFLLGTLTSFATQAGTIIGMICGFTVNMLLWLPTITPLRSIGGLTIPHIAFTWYVLIGSAVTFLIGSLASLILPKPRCAIIAVAAAALLLCLSFPQGICVSCAQAQTSAAEASRYPKPLGLGLSADPKENGLVTRGFSLGSPLGYALLDPAKMSGGPFIAQSHSAMSGPQQQPAQPDFSQVDSLITNAISASKLPGAVVVIGHSGHIVYEHAYGLRKLAGEPGLDGKPSPAEPMTEDTIFDMASLTKCLATATAVMQLYEAGKIASFDDPVQKYLPDFNATNDPQRAKVTLRLLLTHFSGEPADVSLKDPWGLAAPDKAEGIHRALTTPLQSAPAATFRYSDINFILLGALVEKLSGQPEDEYVQQHIFKPLGMQETRYRPINYCNPYQQPRPMYVDPNSNPCHRELDQPFLRIAPAAHDDESKTDPGANPRFDTLLRGTVHDPTTRRMGGVAGHAGVFSTAHDMSLFAQALLDRLAGRPSNFPLKQSTLELMTTPEQPGHNTTQLSAANQADSAALKLSGAPPVTASSSRVGSANASPAQDPLLAPAYPAIKGQDLRAFGWDIDTAFSKPRGRIFPIGSFGHTGFTGTSLWLDPGSDTYVILLANAIHPRGNPPISNLRGEVATAAAQALHLYDSKPPAASSTVHLSKGVILSGAKDLGSSPGAPQMLGAPSVTAASSSSRMGSAGRQPTTSTAFKNKAPGSLGAPPVTVSSSHVGSAGRQPTDPQSPIPHLVRTAYSLASRYSKPSGLGLTSDGKEEGLVTQGFSLGSPLGYALPQTGTTQSTDSPKRTLTPEEEKARKAAVKKELHGGSHWCDEKHTATPLCPAGSAPVLTGIDVLESSDAAALKQLAKGKPLKLGLLTNQSGLDREGHRTIDYLASLTTDNGQRITLATLFSPEHGISGAHDTTHIGPETDEKTGLPVTSLYGPHESDRRPSHDQLKDLDAVVIDIQDAGVRTYTYPAVVGYFLEASAAEMATYHHDLAIVILDRPNLIDGSDVQGFLSEPGEGVKYSNYTPLPVRHGLTLGEFARYIRLEKHVAANLVVVPMQGWQRNEYMDQTDLPWINPSPNLRNQNAAILLPALTLLETTNVSVGRGTTTPFELFGAGTVLTPVKVSSSSTKACHLDRSEAKWRDPCISPDAPHEPTLVQTAYEPPSASRYPKPSGLGLSAQGEEKGLQPLGYALSPQPWFQAAEVAKYLTARKIPGVTFEPTTTEVDNDPIHPFHGHTIEAVRIHITDRTALDTPELGIEMLAALHKLYPTDFKLARAANMVANKEILEALTKGDDPRTVAASWQPALDRFKEARKPYLLY